jgi:hypothetical protein
MQRIVLLVILALCSGCQSDPVDRHGRATYNQTDDQLNQVLGAMSN